MNHFQPPQPIDLLLSADWILPIVPAHSLLEGCAIAIDQGKIVALVPQQEAAKRYAPRQRIALGKQLLMPGLVNAHGHAAMSLLRGFADDLPLQQWLRDSIWPTEARWVSPEFVRDGTQLALAEMIRSGTTCFADMYFYPEQAAQACIEAQMRAQLAFPVMDFPTAWGSGPEDYLHKGLRLHDNLRGSALLQVAFGPHAPYSVADAPLQQIAVLAEETGMGIHIHLHETAQEVADSLTHYGCRPSERLMNLGLLGAATQCVHMTQINERDIDLLQLSGASVVHCPQSNLKLASGFCPAHTLLQAGVNVALGSDGAASNNSLDLFSELHLAALLAKAVAGDAAALDAHSALRMATLNGAKALGLEEHIGSLEPGKQADIIALDMRQLEQQPLYHPVSQLVYTHMGTRVTHSWVAGKCLLQDRQLQTLSEHEILSKTNSWRQQISER